METMPCDTLPEAERMGVRMNIELSAILLATDLFIIRLRCCRRPLLVVLVANAPLSFLFIFSMPRAELNVQQSGRRLICLNDLGRSGSGSTSNITRRRSSHQVVVADLSPPRVSPPGSDFCYSIVSSRTLGCALENER